MSRVSAPLPPMPRMAQTSRKDNWWVQPLLVFLGLSAFIVYSTWAAFQGSHYFAHAGNPTQSLWGHGTSVAHYLSPMYSPVIFDAPAERIAYAPGGSGHAWMGPWPSWLSWLPVVLCSPAILILWIPAGFRFTCYYYRGAYYKAFWGDPLSCAVGEPKFRGKKYRGERWFPLVFQNVHRYFFYLAALFIAVLTYDAILSYWFVDPVTDEGSVGLALGSLVLTINPILLGGYTFGCHCLRHLIGGRFDRLSEHPGRQKAYRGVSCLNRRHMLWAWMSLFWVGFTDFYVRMVSMGVWTDWRLI